MNPEEVARAQSAQGTFSFIERLQGRNMPKRTVDVWVDEATGRTREGALLVLADLTDPEDVRVVEEDIARLDAILEESRATFHLTGITNERYDEIIEEADEAFPPIIEEERNPFTGQKERTVVMQPDREALVQRLVWASCIEKVVTSDGSVDENITATWVKRFIDFAPSAAITSVMTAIHELRSATNWMDSIQDSDFLAKS